MTLQTADIQPTAAELEKIKIDREKAEILEKEKRIARVLDNEKRILNIKTEMSAFSSAKVHQNQAANQFCAELNAIAPGLYQIVEKPQVEHFELYNYLSDEEAASAGISGKKQYYFQEQVDYKEFSIARTDFPSYTLKVKETFEKSRRFSTTQRSEGYKMFVHGIDYNNERKALKNASTVHKNIQGDIDSKNYINEQDRLLKEGWDLLFRVVKAEHPEATIEKDDRYTHNPYRRNDRGSYTKLVIATFPNGLKVEYSFRYHKNTELNDGTMVLRKDIYDVKTSKLDQAELVAALKNVSAEKKSE